jgi:O-antigen/teichoic acid export membrane protein
VAEVVAAAGLWALLGFERGVLQAGHRYGVLARNLLLEAGARTLATCVLVAAGAGVTGAAAGVLLADAVALAHARARVRGAAHDVHVPAQTTSRDVAGGGMRTDTVAALCVLALLAVLQTLDVLVVGREAPTRSGSYAAISVTSKALIFVAFSLSQYLLPEAARRFSEGRHALRQLAICLGLLAVPAVGLLGVAVVAPELLLRTVFGADLVDAAPALATLVLATASLASAVLFAYYLLGGRQAVGRGRAGLRSSGGCRPPPGGARGSVGDGARGTVVQRHHGGGARRHGAQRLAVDQPHARGGGVAAWLTTSVAVHQAWRWPTLVGTSSGRVTAAMPRARR